MTPSGAIALTPIEGGVVLAIGLAGVQWAGAVLAGRSLARCGAAAVVGALAALPLQLVVIVATGQGVASGLLPVGLARPFLDLSGAVLVAAGGLGRVLLVPAWGRRTERPNPESGSVPC